MDTYEELLNKINDLEAENANLISWQSSANQLMSQMLDMMSKQQSNIERIESQLNSLTEYSMINRYRINSLPYEMQDPDYKSFYFKPNIISKSETIRLLIEEHKSIARLGDGEFAAIVGQKRWNFQDKSDILASKLKEVLNSDDENMLIGLNPMFYMNLLDVPEDDADSVRAYMHPVVRRLHAELLSPTTIYGDANFNNIKCSNDVAQLKNIWDGRACVFIEGIHTCMGVGNDLFDNCGSIERILGPAENAIDRYDEILNEALKQPKDKLILIALGPTATVLAYELSREGYQAIDIGHVDLAYEAFISDASNMYSVHIPYKYCSSDERVSGRIIEPVDDPYYKSQILSVIQ